MKYPWVAINLAIVWFGSTFLIINTDAETLSSTAVLFFAIIGTIAISIFGFRAPKVK